MNEEAGGILDEEGFDASDLDTASRDFLERAIGDCNALYGTSSDNSAAKFENYYKDLARRVKDREVALVIVVDMFLTGRRRRPDTRRRLRKHPDRVRRVRRRHPAHAAPAFRTTSRSTSTCSTSTAPGTSPRKS